MDAPTRIGNDPGLSRIGRGLCALFPLARGVFGQNYPDIQASEKQIFAPQFRGFNPTITPAILPSTIGLKPMPQIGVTVSALAMAWVLHRGDHLIPIPGTRTAEHLAEWSNADQITLSQSDMVEIETILPVGFAYGDRYSHAQSRTAERYC